MRVAVAISVLAIGSSLDVIQWDRAVSSDSLSVSLCIGALAAALWLRERWTAPRFAAFVVLVFAVAFERDSNAAFLGVVAVVVLGAVLVRALPRRALFASGVLVLAAVLGTVSADAGNRGEIPDARRHLGVRLLMSPERTAFLLSRGMPLSPSEIRAARGQCLTTTPQFGCVTIKDPRFFAWLHQHGRAAYAAMLVHFPATTVAEPVEHLDWSLGTRVRLESQTGERAPVSQLLETVIFVRNPLALVIVALLIVISCAFMRRRRLRGPYVFAAVLILLTYPHRRNFAERSPANGSEERRSPSCEWSAVGIENAAIERRCDQPRRRPEAFGTMRPEVAARTFTSTSVRVPVVERGRRSRHRFKARGGVDQVIVGAGFAFEMLTPHAQSRIASEPTSTVAPAARVERMTGVDRFIEHCARQLRVVSPGTTIQVVGSDIHPDIVDDAHFCVDVDRGSPLVLEVVHRDTGTAGRADHLEDRLAADSTGGAREAAVSIGKARYDDHEPQLGFAAQRLG